MQQASMANAPKIYIKDPMLLVKEDFDMLLMSKYDIFYRRIVEFVLESFEGEQVDDLLAIIIDGDNNEFEMRLPESGFIQSLEKASIYFLKIEEYETCSLIKSLIKNYE
jgi:hypothetical protein